MYAVIVAPAVNELTLSIIARQLSPAGARTLAVTADKLVIGILIVVYTASRSGASNILAGVWYTL
jgi:hypothetical protein